MRYKQSIRTYLQFLSLCDESQRSAIIKTSTSDQLKAIMEIIYNLLHGTIPLARRYKIILSRYKDTIRKLTERQLAVGKRKTLLKKLQSVIPIIIRIFFKHEQGVDTNAKT